MSDIVADYEMAEFRLAEARMQWHQAIEISAASEEVLNAAREHEASLWSKHPHDMTSRELKALDRAVEKAKRRAEAEEYRENLGKRQEEASQRA